MNDEQAATRRPKLAILVDYFEGEYQTGLIDIADRTARRLGYDLCIVVGRALGAPEPQNRAQNDIYSHLRAPTIDGLVLGAGCMGIYQTPKTLAEFCTQFAPISICSVSTQLPGIPSLVVSNRRGMQLPIDHLIEEHGCQQIAYIRGPLLSEEAEERFQGYLDSLKFHGLVFDPNLVETGNFWIDSGAQAMQRFLDRGAAFDALVAANDYMALGAMSVLKAKGIRVPHTVRVVGFDDVQSAIMASPSLTTVRQPIQQLGSHAVEFLHDSLRGTAPPLRHELDVELITRQSCGCGYRVKAVHSSTGLTRLTQPVIVAVTENRRQLIHRLNRYAEIPAGSIAGWAERLMTALADELQGKLGRFLLELEDLLDEAQPNSLLIERFYTVILILRTELAGLSTEDCAIAVLDDIWHAALLLISDATRRSHLSSKHDAEQALVSIRDTVERLSTTLSQSALARALEDVLKLAKIRSGAVSIYTDPDRTELRPLVVHGRELDSTVQTSPFEANLLAPPGFFDVERPHSYVVMPITFGTEHLGMMVLESGAHNSIYMMLREQIGATLKAASLHRNLLQQSALRERAEREQLQKETAIAQQIQTAMLPRSPLVPGFEISASMLPATSVGGDYCDVIPSANGAWFGFGDVTGHGLLSGLIMLMIQSMVAASVATLPGATPRQIVTALNRTLFDNVRHRLDRNDHATFTLIRYDRGGSLTMAGSHEVVLLVRAATGTCEQLSVPGFWLGAIADVDELTSDLQAQLEPGDLLVLYSDGITESMNVAKEQFGVERLVALLLKRRHESPNEICESVLKAAKNWGHEQIDDMTLLVARYLGDEQS
jgi:DNA-binding LacI/PurR family transcriptional regulator/serine phosphatase RsbU (regulator of sigma subunit)